MSVINPQVSSMLTYSQYIYLDGRIRILSLNCDPNIPRPSKEFYFLFKITYTLAGHPHVKCLLLVEHYIVNITPHYLER